MAKTKLSYSRLYDIHEIVELLEKNGVNSQKLKDYIFTSNSKAGASSRGVWSAYYDRFEEFPEALAILKAAGLPDGAYVRVWW